MKIAIVLLLAVIAGCALLTLVTASSNESNLEMQAAVAQVRGQDAMKKAEELTAEVSKMSAEIKAIREEQLELRARLAAHEARLAEAPLPQAPPAIDQQQRELEYLEKRYGRLEPEQQRLAKEAAQRLTEGTGTREDAVFLEQQIGSNELSDAFYEKNGEDLGAVREAIE